jgi:hypothetical protein
MSSMSSIFRGSNQVDTMPPEDPEERKLVALEYRHYLVQFCKAVVYGQRKDFWRSTEGSFPLSALLINVISMTDLLQMDEYCSLFLFINVGSPEIIESLICRQHLAINQNWIVKLTWAYSIYELYQKDTCVENVMKVEDETSIVTNFVRNIEELLSRDIINIKDPQMKPFQCIFETMLGRLINFKDMSYYVRMIHAFMDNQTQPQFRQLGKILYVLADTASDKKQYKIDIINILKIYIDTNTAQDGCFLECNDSVHEMDKYLNKIVGMDEKDIGRIHTIIGKDTALDNTGFIVNKFEKEKSSNRGLVNRYNEDVDEEDDEDISGNESDETYENNDDHESESGSNNSSSHSNNSNSSSSSSSSSSNESDDDNEKLMTLLKRKREDKKKKKN